jgi:glycosyltransferase involved in cell wall biosynthesis
VKKVLFVQPVLGPPGGGNAVANWMLEALKQEHAVTVLTWQPFDVAAINRFYGTSFRRSDFTVLRGPLLLRLFFRLDPDPESFQPHNYLLRLCKQIGHEYDVLITSNNESDFGRRGIQYIHYPYLSRQAARSAHLDGASRSRRLLALLQGKLRPWMFISDYSFERMRSNLTLVNSDWTGRRVNEQYGTRSITLYPPVPGAFPHVPWDERDNSFICIGRLAPGKRFERIIEILAQVRRAVPGVRLHIVGTQGVTREERAYYRRLSAMVQANASWVHLHENLPRGELVQLIARQRYGLHAQVDEHFGIAVGEMVCAGCITFVHNSGGQVEIVGNDPRLGYDTTEDAVRKIASVLSDRRQQADLRQFLDTRKELFSTQRFVHELRNIVRAMHQERRPNPTAPAGAPQPVEESAS